MSLMRMPWAALLDMQPQRSHQIAWFVFGWIEREQVLNVTACADWWMRAMGLSEAQLKAARQAVGSTDGLVKPLLSVHDLDRAETNRPRSSRRVESLS
ncbi:hypothetical protein [Methylibium sp.]|uniref:hypothetical protein n=1 Tax=Methylibium sp. TaxID=2067992 RepID=UPI003D0DFDE9